jgi:dipeptide/tripeptide permease
MAETRATWRFPAPFWIGNSIELFERAAYYGTFIALVVFLTKVVGYSDVQAGWVGAGFSGLIFLLPFVLGAVSDRIGFRPALLIAFALLACGYALLGLVPTRGMVLVALALVACGGAFVKPIIGGTVTRYSDESNRARAFSLFYMIVNIGSFTGKTVAAPVRKALGVGAVPLYSAGAALVALLVVALLYRPKPSDAAPRSVAESLKGLATVLRNGRFLALILITAGFWTIQGQLYASMPKYVLRMVGEGASPEWYANINPLVVVLLVVPITQLVRRLRPVASIGIALGLIPLSALLMSCSSFLPREVSLGGWALPSITVTMALGIALQGLAECFLSPRYLEFASKQAPAGQEGLYLGYAQLNTFFAWLFGFVLSGYLLEAFCPDPSLLSAADQAQRLAALAGQGTMPAAYAQAHFIWYAFAAVGFVGFAMLLVFQAVTRVADRRAQEAAAPQP